MYPSQQPVLAPHLGSVPQYVLQGLLPMMQQAPPQPVQVIQPLAQQYPFQPQTTPMHVILPMSTQSPNELTSQAAQPDGTIGLVAAAPSTPALQVAPEIRQNQVLVAAVPQPWSAPVVLAPSAQQQVVPVAAVASQPEDVKPPEEAPPSVDDAGKRRGARKSHYLFSSRHMSSESSQNKPSEPLAIAPAFPASAVAEQSVDGTAQLRVSGGTTLRNLAGAVARRVRKRQHVVVEAMGPSCVALSVEALCVANAMLDEVGVALMAVPAFQVMRADSFNKTSVRLLVLAQPEGVVWSAARTTRTINVTKWSITRKIAGAVANVTRSATAHTLSRSRIIVNVSCGSIPASINTAIKALALARNMLEDEGLDFVLLPHQASSDVQVQSVEEQSLVLSLVASQKQDAPSSSGHPGV